MKSFAIKAHVEDEFAATRRSLVSRLKNWEDKDSWRKFFELYWKLIYSVAVKAGLSDEEAEDVVQETVLSVAKKMPSFEYDPRVCSFKGWLMHVTRLRIIDQLRKRPPIHDDPLRPSGNSTRTATIERIPDPNSVQLEAIWDEEWQKNLIDAAMERVKGRVNPQHYQMFYLSVVKRLGTGEIARMLGTNAGHVYLVKHRLAALVKKEVRILEAARK